MHLNCFLTVGVTLALCVHSFSVSHNVSPVERSKIVDLEERGISTPVGLAWADNSNDNLKYFKTSQTKYLYTWTPVCPSQAKSLGLECCPMLGSTSQINSFQENKYRGGKCVMGMNEVNVNTGSGGISVSQGIQMWNQYIRPMSDKGYTLISPSVTATSGGISWLKQFYAQCGGSNHCDADATAMHYFGISASDFISWAERFHALGNGKVWVTEIACQSFTGGSQCTQNDVYAFMDATTSWVKKTSWAEVYFFYGLFENLHAVSPVNRMVNPDGEPNALGKHYIHT